jgi:hypothetical protein
MHILLEKIDDSRSLSRGDGQLLSALLTEDSLHELNHGKSSVSL